MSLTLTIACDSFELVRGLRDKTVYAKDIELRFQPEMTNPTRHKAMVRDLAFDICEMNICTYLIAREAGVSLTALPVFLFRKFRHGNIFIRPDGPIKSPEDLSTARIGCPNLQAAAVIWASGILRDTFGIDQRGPIWVTEREEDLPFTTPTNLKLERAPPGHNVADLLIHGDLDAIITPQIPELFLVGEPRIARLFPDYADRERAYYVASGLFPIMHVTAIKSELVDKEPWIIESLLAAFEASKRDAYERLRLDRTIPLAWFSARWEEERRLLGDDPWIYGLGEQNRRNLTTIIEYTNRQGLISAPPSVEKLFVLPDRSA